MPRTRTLAFSGEVGFPTGLYFDLLDILEAKGYEVRKKEDWLEVNPQSDYYQELIQKRQAIQQQVGLVTDNISDLRKEIEMLRHDKRKLDRIIEHEEGGDLDTLKSDFVDLVDRHTEMSLQNLANSGRFPSILVDFYKLEDESDIEKLEVSEAEKGVLKRKWELFQDWLGRYVKEIKKRDRMIQEELESKKARLEYYKDMLQPYAKALRRINLTEPNEYKGLDDPRLVERYSTSITGVELYAWRDISIETREVYPAEKGGERERAFYSFLDIKIKKRSIVQKGQEKERIEIEINPEIKNWIEIDEVKEELRRREKEILQSVSRAKGDLIDEELEDFGEEEEEESTLKKVSRPIEDAVRSIVGKPREGELVGSEEEILEEEINEDVEDIYKRLKESADALKLRKGG